MLMSHYPFAILAFKNTNLSIVGTFSCFIFLIMLSKWYFIRSTLYLFSQKFLVVIPLVVTFKG